MTTVMSAETHSLYRLFDAAGTLLYVGQTMNPVNRMSEHRADKQWWSAVRAMTVEWFPGRDELLEAERAAIATENPLHNLARPLAAQSSVRTVRVPDDLWLAVQDRAWANRETVSDVIRAALVAYAAEEKGREIHE